jgi:tetratricopeptide (TPR) repeat protein
MRYASAYEHVFLLDASHSLERTIVSSDHEPSTGSEPSKSIDIGLMHFMNASHLASLGNNSAAEEEFSRAILLMPNFPLARYQFGFLQFLQGRAAQAQLTWQPLLHPAQRTAEFDTLACFVEGFLALSNNNLNQAIALFQMGLNCGFNNEPLLDDARKIIRRIENSMRENQDGATAAISSTDDASSSEAHVLLNGYLRADQ